MATLTADVLKIIEPLIEKVREKRDISVSIFISYDGVSINIYPFTEDEMED